MIFLRLLELFITLCFCAGVIIGAVYLAQTLMSLFKRRQFILSQQEKADREFELRFKGQDAVSGNAANSWQELRAKDPAFAPQSKSKE